ncbi:MAG: hypothetical protein JNG86_21735 [Verrucomicrobiaceae bacterium]|nr:hypothetical protein [Verrucomicrobiaceae bacterium]
MNPKQIACFILMALIGVLVYAAQIVHGKVTSMRTEAEDALTAATTAETERSTAEIQTAMVKTETEEVRRFLRAWLPSIDKVQTQNEVEQAIELSLRESRISLIINNTKEVKTSSTNKLIPKSVLASITIEDEYAKVLNWLGDLERRLPLARMKAVQVSGGASGRQLKLNVSFETPLFDLASVEPKKEAPKKEAEKKS